MDGEVLQRQAEYWRVMLVGAPALLELPTDYPRPARQQYAGSVAKLVLDEALSSGIKALARRYGATMYMTLLAGWAALLSRLSGQQDIVIGTPVANRNRVETEDLVGFFVNTISLRLNLSGAPTVSALIEQARTRALDAQRNQDIPFEQVVELVRPVRSLNHTPIFQVMFAWRHTPRDDEVPLSGLKVGRLRSKPPRVTSRFDLTLSLQERGPQIVGGLEYATSLFEHATIERYLGYFRNLLKAMVADET